jgi:hypothetical protein
MGKRSWLVPDTQPATPDGEQAIGRLQVGDQVTACDPDTGKASTQMVEHVWINHDNDLLDVTLAKASGVASTNSSAPRSATGHQSFPYGIKRHGDNGRQAGPAHAIAAA